MQLLRRVKPLLASVVGVFLLTTVFELAARLMEVRGNHHAAGETSRRWGAVPFSENPFSSAVLEFQLPNVAVLDPVLGYRLRPSAVSHRQGGVRINEQGFRGSAVQIPKPPGTYRVLALGGSTTFGLGVGEDETYPALLEADLNARCRPALGQRIEVLNGGVPGYTSTQTVILLEQQWVSYKPDLLLLMEGLNDLAVDPEKAVAPLAGASSERILVPRRYRLLLLKWYGWSITHSAFVRWMASQVAHWRQVEPPDPEFPLAVLRRLDENFTRILKLADAAHCRVAIVGYPGVENNSVANALAALPLKMHPTIRRTFRRNEFEPVADFMREWARTHGVLHIELRGTFANHRDGPPLYLGDGMHFTLAGNALAADAIASGIAEAYCAP